MKPIASISLAQLPMTKDSEFPTQQGVNKCEKWRNKQSTADQEKDYNRTLDFPPISPLLSFLPLSSIDLFLIYCQE